MRFPDTSCGTLCRPEGPLSAVSYAGADRLCVRYGSLYRPCHGLSQAYQFRAKAVLLLSIRMAVSDAGAARLQPPRVYRLVKDSV